LKRSSWIVLVALGALAPAQTVTVENLLVQMTDLEWLASRPSPYFQAAQASSYDRASKTAADEKGWFANGDAGKYIRIEQIGPRREYVMADLKGPGAVVRVWSANPMGTIRFYFDGESNPRLEQKTADLLTGKVAPFQDPLAYIAGQGTNLYFPFPYAKSLKITVQPDKAEHPNMYYQVGFRTYDPGTRVETYDPERLPREKIAAVVGALSSPPSTAAEKQGQVEGKLTARNRKMRARIDQAGGGMVKFLQVKIPFPLVVNIREMDWDDPFQPHNVLRNSRIRIWCDGEKTVDVPLGDFFATAPGPNAGSSRPLQVTTDGSLTSMWPMPFRSRLEVEIEGPGKVEVPVALSYGWNAKPFTPETYYFRAIYNTDSGNTRPMRDMEFLSAKGEGLFVGTHLHVTNPTPAWWGEGDEKIYVDNETFPSTFGTGTEDYFGYAWCSPQLFDKPYHGQARCDGPANFGQTSVRRFQVFDPIPFRRAFKFDIEMWHWAAVEARFARTTYWYSKPGATAKVDPIRPEDLLLVEVKPAAPVKGAIEGESLSPKVTGGKFEMQEGFWELSGGKQIWWMDAQDGDTMLIPFPVNDAGRYQVFGNFCHAQDYGIHSIRVLDPSGNEILPAREFDFYGQGVSWKKLSLGTANLPKGIHTLEVVCKGKRPAALPRQMFGLDYLILERK
jgi:hypothetical protein